MAQPVIQTSFNSGEWAPALNARVDLARYHAGAALLRNFFVDYRGGASTRAGTKYILQCYKSATAVRLIPFQASFSVSYVLEFGDQYIRFSNNGAAVLENAVTITGVTGNQITATNTYSVGDWVFVAGVSGITNINGKYFIVASASGASFTVTDLVGGAVTFAGSYVSGGTVARVYTLASPYAASELAQIKFAQNVDVMVLCHPNHPPYELTIFSATNWTLNPMVIGVAIATPTGQAATTTLGAGSVNYAYVVTAVDIDGEESGPSAFATIAAVLDLRSTGGTNSVTWTAVAGAKSYNVYKAELRYTNAVPTGAAFGFIGNCTGTTFTDSNIAPDFSLTPPIAQNPFQGAGVDHYTVGTAGTYSTPPGVTVAAPPAGATATAQAALGVTAYTILNTGINTYTVGQIVTFGVATGPGQFVPYFSIKVLSVSGGTGGASITSSEIYWQGSVTVGTVPSNPLVENSPGGTGCDVNVTNWGVVSVTGITPGAGYTTAPAVTFASGAAAATAVLGSASSGNPTVPYFFQQRMVLAGPPGSPQQFNMSQPDAYHNFDTTDPIQADDAIQGTLVSGQLNTIKSMIGMPTGLIVLSDRQAWLISGSSGAAVSPIDITANSHSYNGSADLPPIVANFDILYVQSKGSIVRDLTFNFYANIFTGTDISILSSHLFYGHTLSEWAWAEEPFKVVWAVRDDGVLLSLTYLKEQELIAWAHSDTQGSFKSVATITERLPGGAVDALYTVVERTINGHVVKYIERMAERIFPNGATDAWCVDAGLQYNGAPATSFTGGEHLAGATVTGLADGLPITPFVMPASGDFTLATAASKVTIGLGFTPQLQTLAIDLGEPTAQGKRKKITAVTVRVQDTLGLSIGSAFSNGVPMKDLTLGNVGSATNTFVTGLVTADARTLIDPLWQVPGQYCIQQLNPLPASILGVIPEITIGDTPR